MLLSKAKSWKCNLSYTKIGQLLPSYILGYAEHIFKRRLVAFKGGFVGPSVGRSVGRSVLKKFFKKFWKRGFVNQIDMRLDSTY